MIDEEQEDKNRQWREDSRNRFRRDPFFRLGMRAFWRVVFHLGTMYNPLNPYFYLFLKYGSKDFYFKEGRTGLLEGAILANPLYFPEDDSSIGVHSSAEVHDSTRLDRAEAAAGRWAAYDFQRRKTFGKRACSLQKGRLMSIVTDEVAERSGLELTPTGSVDVLWNIDHLFCLNFPSLETVLQQELLRPTTYERAFADAGLSDRYHFSLATQGISESQVYQVTPKGNGVVYLMSDGGQPHSRKNKANNPVFEGMLLPETA